ncbi:hypothetical protein MNAN1_001544 [Malassezia nana]|uniref:Proline iminopeptidase n=1 Tax=Malassezia nana TaxID=180528 RepID=A0AAF0EKQ2_9BASI|nr:hypothetical protein MNAN1_001544 [Malassezia nana]
MYLSQVTSADWSYPQSEPVAQGHLDVQSSGHQIYWAEYGNPQGEPVMCVHGGPGGGSDAYMARFFAPERYRVVVFDQRGCGQSSPSASDDDALPALVNNTTAHLIEDMNKLRAHRGITGPMHLFGGSWGSTLSLAYAIAHPENVARLILRGIFLCRQKDLDFFYQGNAAVFEQDPFDTSLPGSYQFFPEAWEEYVRVIPPSERHDMIRAYDAIFSREPSNEAELQHQIRAAQAWANWEGQTSYLARDTSKPNHYNEAHFAKAFARIENHYFINGAFLGGSGEANRQQNYILSHVDRLRTIPIHIVHGRYDMVCPLFQAEELVAALHRIGHKAVDFRRTPAGHSMLERDNCLALTDILDHLPPLTGTA